MNLRKSAHDDGVVDEAGHQASRKKLLVAGGVATALAVVAAMAFVFLTGGDDAVDNGPVASARRPGATATTTPTVKATAAPSIKKFNGSNARDPFKALVVEQAASTGAASATGSSGGSTSGGTTGGTAGGSTPSGTTGGSTPGGTGATTGSASPTSVRSTATTSSDPVTITLVSVAPTDVSASFTVNAKQYKNVKPQQTFGTYFKLLNLTGGKCGAVQYGDVTFQMCESDSLTLR